MTELSPAAGLPELMGIIPVGALTGTPRSFKLFFCTRYLYSSDLFSEEEFSNLFMVCISVCERPLVNMSSEEAVLRAGGFTPSEGLPGNPIAPGWLFPMREVLFNGWSLEKIGGLDGSFFFCSTTE